MNVSAEVEPAPSRRSRFVWLAAGIVLVALLARLIYVFAADVDYPLRGDSGEYVRYAWNLVHRGMYSMALPGDRAATTSGYRAPGYPWLIAAMMGLAGHSQMWLQPLPDGKLMLTYASTGWITCVLVLQAILGTLTVALSMLVARFWLKPGWTLLLGAMIALWPAAVTFAGALLSETLFAFSVVLALWLCMLAQQRRSAMVMALAGLAFGFAYLVNPIILLPAVAWALGLCCVRAWRKLGLVLLLGVMIAPCAWAAARHSDPPGQGSAQRAELTFVVGTWPDYYAAWDNRMKVPAAAKMLEQEGHEQDLFIANPPAGLALIRARMADDPYGYLRWYALEKPFLDWDWSIRMGGSDIAVPATTHSPFVVYPGFRAIYWVFRWINPWLFGLTLISLVWLIVALARKRARTDMPWFPALIFVSITAAHCVLQAEPRYSLPFRSIQFVLVLWLLQQVADRVRNRRPEVSSA